MELNWRFEEIEVKEKIDPNFIEQFVTLLNNGFIDECLCFLERKCLRFPLKVSNFGKLKEFYLKSWMIFKLE